MHFRRRAEEADIHTVEIQVCDLVCGFFVDESAVGLEIDSKAQIMGVMRDFPEIFPQKRFSSGKREKERTQSGQLVQILFDLFCGQLISIGMVEIAEFAAQIAARSNFYGREEGDMLLF